LSAPLSPASRNSSNVVIRPTLGHRFCALSRHYRRRWLSRNTVGAVLLVDMTHFAGLVAGGVPPNPIPHAHVCTATTYKNLRGVRGGLILSADTDLSGKLNSAVFPGVQGSVILNAVSAKAVYLGEALRPGFVVYARSVLANARALATAPIARGLTVVTGGTDTPLLLVDLRPHRLTGADVSQQLELAGLTCNKNGVPGDTQPPTVTSGVRLGVSAGTTRGFDTDDFELIGNLIADVMDAQATADPAMETIRTSTRAQVRQLTQFHRIYTSTSWQPVFHQCRKRYGAVARLTAPQGFRRL
jgi:glycine hydroxymethyltransferase